MIFKLNDLIFTKAYIDGQFVDASDGKEFEVIDKATGKLITKVADATTADTQQAIDAAEQAFKSWSALTAKHRCQILRKWYDLMMENQDVLAELLSLEQGKSLAESKGEIAYGASFIEWFSEEGKRSYGHTIPTVASDKRILTIKQPIGVVAAITPWNFPNAMITRKVGPALACGCTVVLKPALETPLSALALAYLGELAGIPHGVFNVVPGSDAVGIGKVMCDSPVIKKLTFTGSTRVGKILMQQCADTVKKLSLELGGNAPFIVFDDADIDEAVKGAIAAKFRNSGQTCVCANRIYAQEGVYDEFVKKLSQAVSKLVVGPYTNEKSEQGPLISKAAVAKVKDHIDNAVFKGACVITGGKEDKLGGLFFEPTVLANVTADMKVAKEETFGPLAPVFKFKSEQEVIELANDTEFGLASYFYSRDIGRIYRVAEAIESGMVGVNTGLISNEVAPFGGIKQSGLGREGSSYGIDEYMELKYICIGGVDK